MFKKTRNEIVERIRKEKEEYEAKALLSLASDPKFHGRVAKGTAQLDAGERIPFRND